MDTGHAHLYCPSCGAATAADRSPCVTCAAAPLQRCPSCAAICAADARYCYQCGTALTVAERPPAELRLATVLFADLSGFTALSERLTAEQTAELVNRCFDRLAAQVFLFGGKVDKFVGDAVMACFGAPTAHEDDPVRAILAALGMQRAIADLNLELQRSLGMQIALRIGINTGEVLAGHVGGAGRFDYTVMGDTVNLASRLEHECRLGHVLVGERTHHHAADAFTFRAMDPLPIRGKREPVQAYEVLAPRPQQGAAGSSVGFTPLVGRQRELAQLAAALDRALASDTTIVAVRGEAGVGKTRLLEEARRRLPPALAVVRTRAVSYGQPITYSLLAAFVRALLDLEEIEGDALRAAIPAALHRTVGAQPDGDPATDAALLGAVLGLPLSDPRMAALEPRLRHLLLARAVARLVRARVRRAALPTPIAPGGGEWEAPGTTTERRREQAGLVLAFEDIHWADRASMAVILDVLSSMERLPVVMSERTENVSVLPPTMPDVEMHLPRLAREELRQLVRGRLGDDDVPERLLDLLLERTDGNPSFALELVANLREIGSLRRAHGRWELDETGAKLLPSTILGVLQAHLDRLSAPARRVAQVAAVVGRTVSRPLLAAVLPSMVELDPALAELGRADILLPVPGSDQVLRFRQSLIQEAAYAGLPISQRRQLHSQVGEQLLAQSGAAASLELLAYHFERGDDPRRAIEYLWLAAERDRSLYANEAARDRLLRCLALLDQIHGPVPRSAVLAALGDLEALAGRYEAAAERYQQALDALPSGAGGEQDATAEAFALTLRMADTLLRRARYDEAQRVAQAIALTTDLQRAQVRLLQGRVALAEGRLDEATGSFQACIDLLAGTPAPAVLAQACRQLGNAQAQRAQYVQAASSHEQALLASRQAEDLQSEAAALRDLGSTLVRLQRWREAEAHLSGAIALSERIGDRGETARALADLAASCQLQGRWQEAREKYHRAMLLFEQEHHTQWVARVQANLARLHLDIGQPDQALQAARRSAELFESIGHRAGMVVALVNLAEALLQTRAVEEAQEALARAVALRAEAGLTFNDSALAIVSAELCLVRGQDDAVDRAGHALQIARQSTAPLDRIKAWRLLGRAYVQRELWDEADTALREGLELARAAGDRYQIALTEIELARVLQHQGRAEEAQRLLAHAQEAQAPIGGGAHVPASQPPSP